MIYLMWQLLIVQLLLCLAFTADVKPVQASTEEHCQFETFSPRCSNNEVILMESANYGRMRIGKCITAEEVAEQGHLIQEDPRILGCSADVLSMLDRKCSLKSDCQLRVSDIAAENIRPCLRGLNVYLEASYDCINVVDAERSCSVTATKIPLHIIGSPTTKQSCGTKTQPWIVNTRVGQKIRITLIDVRGSFLPQNQGRGILTCDSSGLIIDKAGKNVSICKTETKTGQREMELFTSVGNSVEILFNPSNSEEDSDNRKQFLLQFQAIGCSDIIPPEDTWLKRNDEVIAIGCYSSRQTWRLNCKEGKWVGVLGNCSHDPSEHETGVDSVLKSGISSDEQVLAVVAICGCTLAICLAIMCIGAVCLRRFYAKNKKNQAYKTLNFHSRSQNTTIGAATGLIGTEANGFDIQSIPTYSVYVGQSETDNSRSADIGTQ